MIRFKGLTFSETELPPQVPQPKVKATFSPVLIPVPAHAASGIYKDTGSRLHGKLANQFLIIGMDAHGMTDTVL